MPYNNEMDFRIKLCIILPIMYSISFASCQRRFLHGIITDQKQFPFIAFVQTLKPQYVCTGTILDKDWVLTSGSCCTSYINNSTLLPTDFSILVLSGKFLTELEYVQERDVSKVVVNKLYDGELGSADLCLLKANESLNMTMMKYVSTIEVENSVWPHKGEQSRNNCVAVGWGVTEGWGEGFKLEYNNVSANYGINESCPCVDDIMKMKNIICASRQKSDYVTNYKQCTNNNGRTLICDNKLVGIYHGAMAEVYGGCFYVNDICKTTQGYNIYLYVCPHIPWIGQYVPVYNRKTINCYNLISKRSEGNIIHLLSTGMLVIIIG